MLPTSTQSILKSLKYSELKRFGDFIKSPYFNSIASLEIIFDAVLKSYPDFISENLSYENIAKKVFAGSENKEKRIKNLYSEFGNYLRKFLGYEEMRHKMYEVDIFIAEGLARKNLFEDSEKFIKKSIDQNDNGLLTDSLKYNYLQRMNIQSTNNNGNLGRFEEVTEKINEKNESMIASFIREIYNVGNFDTIIFDINGSEKKQTMNSDFLDSIDIIKFLDKLKESNNKYYIYLKINYLLYYYAVKDINEQQFYDLKNEIFITIHKIEKWEAYSIIARVCEIILGKLVPLDYKYYNDLFDFNKLFCELKVFPDHAQDSLHIGMFRDIFNPAIILKDYDWAENFANEYVQYLNEELREDEKNYCGGVLSFKRGNYENSLDFFGKVKPDYILININIRFYYIMNYIELGAFESARSSVNAMRKFVTDNSEIPKFIFVLIPDAIKYLTEIIKCLEQNKKIDGMMMKEANDGRKFNHSIYIKEKMETLK